MGMDVWALRKGESIDSLGDCPPERYFRDSYGPYSLANWLSRNIDPTARGNWGLAIFTEPRLPLESSAWRAELLRLATAWHEAALGLRGRTSLTGYPEDTPVVIPLQDTIGYIEHCEWLLTFAQTVAREELRVVISA